MTLTPKTPAMRVVDDNLIHRLVEQAQNSPRKRAHFRFHEFSDQVQRMVNVLLKDAYIPPHKHSHPDKIEHFVCIKGKAICVWFNEDGSIKQTFTLDPHGPEYAVDILPNTYHMFLCAEEPAVLVEIIEGPYDSSTHKKFAPWAPAENEPNASIYLQEIEHFHTHTDQNKFAKWDSTPSDKSQS